MVAMRMPLAMALLTAALLPAARAGAQQTAAQARADYVAACRNTALLRQLGPAPLAPYLQQIAALTSVHQLAGPVGRLQSYGFPALFGPGGRPLRLPRPPRSQRWRLGLERLFALAGDPAPAAAREARAALQVEVSLASIRAPGPARPLDRAALDRLAPNFDWRVFFNTAGVRDVLPAASPAYLRALNGRLLVLPLASWQSYLRAAWLTAAAPLLAPPFVAAHFAMLAKPVPPRDQLCRAAAAAFPLRAFRLAPIRRDRYFADTLALRAAAAGAKH